MRIRIDRDKCYKSGECYYNHPELFRMAEDGYPLVLVDEITDAATRQHAEQAMEVCPAVAISLEE